MHTGVSVGASLTSSGAGVISAPLALMHLDQLDV